MNTKTNGSLHPQACLLTLLLLSGCAPDAAEDEDVDLAASALSVQRTVHEWPSVSVGGSGCPAGSFRTTRSRGGMQIAITFDAYRTQVSESVPRTRSECFIAIAVPTNDARSYAVTEVTPTATASLKSGAWALWTSVASIDGAHHPSGSDVVRSIQVDGPHEGKVAVVPSPRPLVWSECGKRPDIHVTTIATVQNAFPFSVNYLDVRSLTIALATRTCP